MSYHLQNTDVIINCEIKHSLNHSTTSFNRINCVVNK